VAVKWGGEKIRASSKGRCVRGQQAKMEKFPALRRKRGAVYFNSTFSGGKK
jgi:hypothetical protein